MPPRSRPRAVPRSPKRAVRKSVIAAVDPEVLATLKPRASGQPEEPASPSARRVNRAHQAFAIVSATFVD